MRTSYADSAAMLGEPPVVICTLYTPGFTVRAATRPIQIQDSDGDGPYLYDARLTSVDAIDREVDLFALERAEIRSMRVTLYISEDYDARTLEAKFYHLAASRCEVALIWEGESWNRRDVVIGRGTVSGVSMNGGEVTLTTEALPPATGNVIGDPTRDMKTTGGYPTLGYTKLQGRQYPTIIGRCYRLPGFKMGSLSATSRGLLLAGHKFVSTTTVDTYQDDDAPTAYVPYVALVVTNGTDAAGDPICYIAGGNSGANFDFQDTQGAFTFDATYGGVQSASGSQVAAVGAPEVIGYLLANSGERVDFDKMLRTYALLGGLEIGIYVDKATDALKILRDRVLTVLPLVEEQGAGGMWLRYVDIVTQVPEIDLVEGVQLIGAIGGMEQVSDPDDLYNSFTVNYAYDHATGRFGSSVTFDRTNHPMCALSAQLFGVRAAPDVNVDITWDAATASFIAASRANRLAMPRYATSWDLDPTLYWLQEGTIVSVTSATYGWSRRKAVVRKIRSSANPIRVVLEPVPGALTGGLI